MQYPFGKKKGSQSSPIPNSARANSPRFMRGEFTANAQASSSYSPSSIKIPLVTAMALGLAGITCLSTTMHNSETTRGCVDQNGTVVADSNCTSNTYTSTSHYPYRWHYGGSYGMGRTYYGGSFDPPSTSTRGLFGGSGFHFSGLS